MKTVFLFSGQGSQHFQMGRELFERHAGFRATLERADRLARAHCGESPLAVVFDERHAREAPFDRLLHSHPAIFMVEYALAQALMAAGVQPDIVLGASLGTFAAAAVAGQVGLDAALCAVIDQARIVEAHCEPGAMVAVMGEPATCLTPELLSMCELGARNFATHSVISLPAANLAAVERHLRQRGLVFQRLPVNYAFHSRWIDAAKLPLQEALSRLEIREGNIPIVCCATGDSLSLLSPNQFWSAVREPVEFHKTIHRIESRGHHRYIDGPAIREPP
jgi:trans-AT polyketide synthase/acyltransferase/oxidoreductase domain-containing protein